MIFFILFAVLVAVVSPENKNSVTQEDKQEVVRVRPVYRDKN